MLTVKGDLGNAVRMRHAAKDDIILRRSRKRVLVLKELIGNCRKLDGRFVESLSCT